MSSAMVLYCCETPKSECPYAMVIRFLRDGWTFAASSPYKIDVGEIIEFPVTQPLINMSCVYKGDAFQCNRTEHIGSVTTRFIEDLLAQLKESKSECEEYKCKLEHAMAYGEISG